MSITAYRRATAPRLLGTAALFGLGFLIGAGLSDRGRSPTRRRSAAPAAIRHPRGVPRGGAPMVRPAGPEAMRDPPPEWSRPDEESDQSFPASDPPANY